MSTPLKLSIGIGVTLLVVLIALFLFLRNLVTKSFPQLEGTLEVPGLQSSVQIARDNFGVPYIFAENESDMFFAIGFVHAQDRLWQMDLTRRAGQGRLSEIFGEVTIEIDKLFRTVGIENVARKMIGRLPSETLDALEAYSEGINSCMMIHEGKFPLEFDMLNYRPDPWEPLHTLIVARMIAWELNLSWGTNLALGMVAERVDLQRAIEAFPASKDDAPRIISQVQEFKRIFSPASSGADAGGGENVAMEWGTRFLAATRKYREFFGADMLSGASNAWLIGPAKSSSGKPILANDIHLQLPNPSRWYQIHVSAPGWQVAGASLPGAPFVVIGRNRSIAWGFTNLMADDADFFIEQVDSLFTTYLHKGRQLPLESREETISVGKNLSTILTVHKTHRGPIVDYVHPHRRGQGPPDSPHYAIAMRWTGLDVTDDPHAFYLMNKAQSLQEFGEGLSYFAVPAQNVLAADTAGNIAYWAIGRIPIRGPQSPMLPLPGWTGENDWRGYVPIEKMPRSVNPPEGYIATANNKPISENYPYYISELWEPPYRAARIHHLLNATEILSADDFKRFQLDVVSLHGEKFSRYLLHAFSGIDTLEPEIETALDYLRNWDMRYSSEDVATSLINVSFANLLKNVFLDELGDELFLHYVSFTAIPYRVVSRLLEREQSPWFENISTGKILTRDEILRKSLYDAVGELRVRLGSDMKKWRWGVMHTVTFEHSLGERRPLDNIFNIGPFPVGGGATTINKGDFRIGSSYEVRVGASLRHVIDLGNPASFASVIPTGQSGQAFHPHFDDQTLLWLNGEYHRIAMDWNDVESARWKRLVLRPAR